MAEPEPTHESRQEDIDLLGMLADGEDPLSGAPLDASGPWRDPRVRRALRAAAASLGREADRAIRRDVPRGGNPWTPEEEQRLAAAFDDGQGIAQLAETHDRTKNAITARLRRLGKIDR